MKRNKNNQDEIPEDWILDAAGLARAPGHDKATAAVHLVEYVEIIKEGQKTGQWIEKPGQREALKHQRIASAKEVVDDFKRTHASQKIDSNYPYPDKRILMIHAVYHEPEPDHRIALTARDR